MAYGHAIQAAFAFNENDIDSADHVNGISVTHGNPRQHIWTLAIGFVESVSATEFGDFVLGVCPCHPEFLASIPTFIGDDYFCESGLNGEDIEDQLGDMPYYLDDPLWDGRQCFGDCCRGSPFVKTLANGLTTDPLEIRICNVILILWWKK